MVSRNFFLITGFILLLVSLGGMIKVFNVEGLPINNVESTSQSTLVEEKTDSVSYIIGPEELISPYDRINPKDIHVFDNKIVIDIDKPYISAFADTNSMDPVIDIEANAIQIQPQSSNDIHIGDIISFETANSDSRTIHRVHEIGFDEQGWYAKTKGDNLGYVDPNKVRFHQIKRIVVGILY